ncbi:hypothetical protein [Acinetobacter sp.]|uniref:hypothetical protein n=1 Tax=Acinetobacter sp. TaxID=472 RepID=UPI0035B2AE93
MPELSNITMTETEDGMITLLIDGQPLSEKYGMKFDPSIADELKALSAGQSVKLFEQFVFSHTDLNFEHAYSYTLSIVKDNDMYKAAKNFVYKITPSGQPAVEHIISKQGEPMTAADVQEFIQAHIAKSLTEYTDLKYAY